MRARWAAAAALVLGALLTGSVTLAAHAQARDRMSVGGQTAAGQATVRQLTLDGPVDPFVAGYLDRGIKSANSAGDAAVVLRIDTPGGLDSSMRRIIRAILASRVPVICWTGPAGARAASAGTFVMLACPVNAMARGTNIGAAHPVGVVGSIEQTKVTNDAVAYIRSLAERTHRNADWAESAVRDSASISAEHAVGMTPPVADKLADSVSGLLQAVDGRVVQTAAGRVTIATHAAMVTVQSPGFGVTLMHGLIDPSLAFFFFYVGLILIVIEIIHPGISLPGVVGTLLLVTSVVTFGILPVRLGGLLLLAASVVLFLVELKHPGLGLPLIGGLACLVLGGLLLFDPRVPGAVHVSYWLLGVLTLAVAAFFGGVVRAVLAARRMPRPSDHDELIGTRGRALGTLGPSGEVWVGRERWSAEAAAGTIESGSGVRVVGRRGLHLVVEPERGEPPGTTEGS